MSALRLARGFTGRDEDRQVRGLLPRPRRRPAGRRPARASPRCGCPTAPACPAAYAADTLVAPYNDLDGGRARVFERIGDEIAAVIVEPVAANMGVVPPRAGLPRAACASSARTHGALLIFDEVITGFRVGVRRRAGAVRRHARPDLPRQGRRRRPAGRRLRRARATSWSGRARWAGLPGRHAVRQPAGDGRRASRRCELLRDEPVLTTHLERQAARLERRAARSGAAAGVAGRASTASARCSRCSSLDGPVARLRRGAHAPTPQRYARFFHALLDARRLLPAVAVRGVRFVVTRRHSTPRWRPSSATASAAAAERLSTRWARAADPLSVQPDAGATV